MILLIGGEKGGTGKSMLATNLPVYFHKAGYRVKLIDLDPQGSAERWATKRAGLKREPFIPWGVLSGDNVYFQLREEAKHYEVLICDGGGADSEEFESALAAADVLLSPIVPSDCDMATLVLIEKLVGREAVKGHAIEAWVVLNHITNHYQSIEEDTARASLVDFKHLRTAKAGIHSRAPFRTAYRERISVGELAATSRDPRAPAKADLELSALFDEILRPFDAEVP